MGAIQSMAGDAFVNRLTGDPAIRLLLMSYDLLAVDRRTLAEEALDAVRGHLHAHGVDVELVEVLKELINASEEISWANLERREPMLPGWFKSYDQRAEVARKIGAQLHARGGVALMKQIFDRDLGGHSALSNWWSGVGSWQ